MQVGIKVELRKDEDFKPIPSARREVIKAPVQLAELRVQGTGEAARVVRRVRVVVCVRQREDSSTRSSKARETMRTATVPPLLPAVSVEPSI